MRGRLRSLRPSVLMNADLKEELKQLGAEVRPGSELPGEVREMVERYAPGLPRPGRVGTDFGRLSDEQYFRYEDENLKLEVPVPTLEVFESVMRELEGLGEAADAYGYVSALARAFWLLYRGAGEEGCRPRGALLRLGGGRRRRRRAVWRAAERRDEMERGRVLRDVGGVV